jgi:hypothetical protein
MRVDAARQTAHKEINDKFTSDENIAAYLEDRGIPADVRAKISPKVMDAFRSNLSIRINAAQPITEEGAKAIQNSVLGRFVDSYNKAEEVAQNQEQAEALKALVLARAPRPEWIAKLPELAAGAPEGVFEALGSGDPDVLAGATLEFGRYLKSKEPEMEAIVGEWGADDQGNLTGDVLSLVALRMRPETAEELTKSMESVSSAFQYMQDVFDLTNMETIDSSKAYLLQYGTCFAQGGPQALAERAGRTLERSPMAGLGHNFGDADQDTFDPSTLPDSVQAHLREFMLLAPDEPLLPRAERVRIEREERERQAALAAASAGA